MDVCQKSRAEDYGPEVILCLLVVLCILLLIILCKPKRSHQTDNTALILTKLIHPLQVGLVALCLLVLPVHLWAHILALKVFWG